MSRSIQVEPKPACPACGAQMALRLPEEFWCENWPAFWGCSRFPACRETIEDEEVWDGEDDINDMPFNAWWYP